MSRLIYAVILGLHLTQSNSLVPQTPFAAGRGRLSLSSRVKSYTLKEGPLDSIVIALGSILLERIAPRPRKLNATLRSITFDDFVFISKIFLSLPPDEIKKRILSFLRNLIPLPIRSLFRLGYQANRRFVCEQSSLCMTLGFFDWLVGPSERFEIAVPQPDGSVEQWLSGTKIKECRYLSESGCKAACLHICKDPTQTFFEEELGVPVYMKPNFSDNSCEMMFGVTPPAKANDEAYQQPCFSECGTDLRRKLNGKCT